MAEGARWAWGLEELHECIAGRFRYPEPHRRMMDCSPGLLSPVEHKYGWQLAKRPFGPAQEVTPLLTEFSVWR